MGTGETVAVKQVKLADLPKSELRVITVREACPAAEKTWTLSLLLSSLKSICLRTWTYVMSYKSLQCLHAN